ncbi:hypothetical protein [Knoellia subterranea]|uniref:Alpha/beta hydrolase n=1 Tax=Knoellia subterranea KCTC 19937 TaxID=1385521 RepID=A0A0A0JJZ3_9MICO|nr:hypothetical protein [Knoellia subterranea]KGN37735.1 hypothetical protein N803_11805 [Knoellia subterranea KCTC 19937]
MTLLGRTTSVLCHERAKPEWGSPALASSDSGGDATSAPTGSSPKPAASGPALTDVVAHLIEATPDAKVVVVAASAGGPTAIQLATRADSGIAAAVALSPGGIEGIVEEGETKLSTQEAADNVRVPTLVVTDPDDTSVDSATIARLAADPPEVLTVETLPAASGHAQEVLYDTQNPSRPSAFRVRLLTFLASGG